MSQKICFIDATHSCKIAKAHPCLVHCGLNPSALISLLTCLHMILESMPEYCFLCIAVCVVRRFTCSKETDLLYKKNKASTYLLNAIQCLYSIWALSDYNKEKDKSMPLEINIFLFSVSSQIVSWYN